MAFWGVVVRPSKPYAHNFDQVRGRLRISQATLGDGKSTSKSTVQCNVGDKSPVLLCSLIPTVSETCHLELEFEEDEEVIFSVLGQRSVHLTGYYLGHVRSLDGDDTESYGEDIAESDTSDSYSYGSEDDAYESDFIDDADVAIYPDSQRPKSSVVIEEIEDDDKQHRNFRRLKKKHEISDSEDAETESKQIVVRNKESTKEESEDDDGFPICFTAVNKNSKKKKINDDKKRKANAISQDDVSISEAKVALDSTMSIETASKYNEKSKKKKEKDEKCSIESENDEKLNKQTENGHLSMSEIEEHAKESLNGVRDADKDCDSAPVMSGDPDTFKQSKKKSKKKRVREEGVAVEKNSCEEDKICTKKELTEDQIPVENPAIIDVSVEKKKKKKKNKKNSDLDIKHEASEKEKASLLNGVDESQNGSQAIKTRTFPNGLIVEEVSMGKPDGKKASPGKKVSVRYIGMLKNGIIFYSNIGQKPFKFRLGIGEVIKGWDIGVSGMCIGDKRRLTIPPSFGYGAKGVGKIPPNSWLVFDVELIDVQ